LLPADVPPPRLDSRTLHAARAGRRARAWR
jgi:hypothetical protein